MVGNISNYHRVDVLRVLICLDEARSRSYLVEETGIGEGTIRSILDILKKKGLVKSTTKGHVCTKKGSNLIDELFTKVSRPKVVKLDAFYKGSVKSAVKVSSVRFPDLVGLRDVAVRNGADGALIFVYDKVLELPLYKGRFPGLEENFDFKKGDILILAFSSDRRWAEIGAISAALETSPKIKLLCSHL